MRELWLVWLGFCIGRSIYLPESGPSSVAIAIAGLFLSVAIEIYANRRDRDRHTSNP